jgi:diguanylate cyclase (GGDEF)-like protein
VKEEFREGFIEITSPERVLDNYKNGVREISYECMMKNAHWNEYRWVRVQARLFYYNSEKAVHMIFFNQDISEEKERESRMLHAAETDPLTGFYNKTATQERISAALADMKEGDAYAFVIVDIDYFKNVNDTLGHAAGDRVIKDFAARIKRQFRDFDICGRIGGDEFVVLLRGIPGGGWLNDKMERLSASLRWDVSENRRLDDDGEASSCVISASIGVAYCPRSGTDFDTLYRNADAALYQVKNDGRNGFKIYTDKDVC